jgi:disulfide bond formation protein DsbB
MLKNMIKTLNTVAGSYMYWGSYIAASVILMGIALYYQHILDTPPCLLCIQVRLLLSLLILISFFGLLFKHRRRVNSTLHIATVFVAVAMLERSYQLLGTERGFVFSDCGFDLGLPAWFAIEDWLPWLYRVETTCGYTPEILFNITMAEALMLFSVVFLLISACVALASFLRFAAQD